jgi:hypothetical protein
METARSSSIPGPRCCCGSVDCAFLAHNARLLDGLERDVTKAAQLGQVRRNRFSLPAPPASAPCSCRTPPSSPTMNKQVTHAPSLTLALQSLLYRHEAYVADSERDRREMVATIEGLEKDKMELEAQNAQTIRANRDLLDQLERLNTAAADSDAYIQALSDTLRSTEEELERLSTLAARTQLLEQQLIDLEREQLQLQTSYDSKLVDERTAIQRWKNAERTIGDLQDQIDRIEREAREERERHVEVVARMERRMAVEGELHTAAGRLKAKAGQEKAGTNVVSHFVKDILLDNANLQHGILELREMLMNSNEEVEQLRDQLRVHQPVSSSPPQEDVSTPNLQKELEMEADQVMNQELHIHHHYHGPKISKNLPKPQPSRRPKKKRFSLTPTHFDPPPSQLDRSLTAAILDQTAVTVPNSHRWSQATTLTVGSLPGSPVTESHRGSMYDRVFSDVAYDSSRPTSPPDSIDLQSPMFGPMKIQEYHRDPEATPRHQRRKSHSLKPLSLMNIRSASTPLAITTKSSPATAIISAVSPANSFVNDVFTLSPSSLLPEPQAAIPEESEDSSITSPEARSLLSPDDLLAPLNSMRPPLRRHASHESLISVSGMDIHTLQSRPSQLLYSSSPRFSQIGNARSVGPELTPWTATAHGQLSRKAADSRRSLLSANANQKRAPGPRKGDGPGIGKKVGGWVFGKWGATPTSSTTTTSTNTSTTIPTPDSPRPTSLHTQSSHESTKKKDKAPDRPPVKLRPSGVNQNGPIWGFFDIPEVQVPTKTVVGDGEVDRDALGEALAEE